MKKLLVLVIATVLLLACASAFAEETILDHLSGLGIVCNDTGASLMNNCFLIEGDSSANKFKDDYQLVFEEGGKRYEARGKLVVASERQAIREAFVWILGHADYQMAIFAPFDSDRWVCFGDNGNIDSRNVYYYDKDKYIAVLTELFGIQ